MSGPKGRAPTKSQPSTVVLAPNSNKTNIIEILNLDSSGGSSPHVELVSDAGSLIEASNSDKKDPSGDQCGRIEVEYTTPVLKVPFTFGRMCEIHGLLECIEHRIQMGEDPIHSHPGMCVKVLATETVSNMNQEEIATKNNYLVKPAKTKIPAFWTKRCYDSQFSKMSVNESNELATSLLFINEKVSRLEDEDSDSDFGGNNETSDSSSSDDDDEGAPLFADYSRTSRVRRSQFATRSMNRQRISPHKASDDSSNSPIVRLCTIGFDTDESDDLTDLDTLF